MTQAPPPRQSMIGLFRQLVNGMVELARLEMTRGRQELGQMADDVKAGLLLMGVSFGLLFVALMVILILIVEIITLVTGIPRWLVALFMLVVLVLSGSFIGILGFRKLRVGPPEETIQAVQEDIEWAKRLLRRG
ncbi:MAG TPA: phage holin family protein [Candidatus Limnocylindria bacterium]|nr:phage holin family protein [Candidatus Limnocylindria bacterium]